MSVFKKKKLRELSFLQIDVSARVKLVFLLVETNMVVSTDEYGELKESLAPLCFVLLRRSLQVLHLTERLFFLPPPSIVISS